MVLLTESFLLAKKGLNLFWGRVPPSSQEKLRMKKSEGLTYPLAPSIKFPYMPLGAKPLVSIYAELKFFFLDEIIHFVKTTLVGFIG